MSPRTSLSVLLIALSSVGCAGSKQHERLREQLDAYSLPKPIAEVWPEALRYVSDRGYTLVGKDRLVLGLEQQPTWSTLLSSGHDTRKSGARWTSETARNQRGQRYRIVGADLGAATCRIEFHVINAGDPLSQGQIDTAESEYRDVELELRFIETLDAGAAAALTMATPPAVTLTTGAPQAAALTMATPPAPPEPGAPRPRKIGIIGSGKIGGTLASLWAKAGYEVLLSSRHPETLKDLAASIGPKARVGTPREAAVFGQIVLVSVPYKALPEIGRELAKELAGKVVLETGNPYPERDGEMAVEARRKGTGIASAELLPGVRLVRAFNAISFQNLRSEAHRAGEPVGIPIAGDDVEAVGVAMRLVRDAGFEPVVVGPLSKARLFDVGTAVYTQLLTARELTERLGL